MIVKIKQKIQLKNYETKILKIVNQWISILKRKKQIKQGNQYKKWAVHFSYDARFCSCQYKLIIKQGKHKKTMDVLIIKQENKENSNNHLNKELQRLKVELNDKLFQMNKLQEDYAQQKAKQFIDFQKERQHLNRIIKQLKEKSQMENQQWVKKVQQIRKVCEEDIKKNKQEFQNHIKKLELMIRQECLRQFYQQISLLEKERDFNQLRYKEHISLLESQKQSENKRLVQDKLRIIKLKDKYHQQAVQKLNIQHEKTIKSLQNIYLEEKKWKQSVQGQLQVYIQSNVKQKLAKQHEIEELKQTNRTLLMQITQLNQNITQTKQKVQKMKQQKESQIKQLNIIKTKQLKQIQVQFNKKICTQAKMYQDQIGKVQEKMVQICKLHKQKQAKWQERGQLILKSMNASDKKADNFKVIKTLQSQLMKKEDLLQKQRETLRNCKLQLQNMEDIYDKMFVTNNYLYKFKSKSFKVKKIRVPSFPNNYPSSSIFIEQRLYTQGDK